MSKQTNETDNNDKELEKSSSSSSSPQQKNSATEKVKQQQEKPQKPPKTPKTFLKQIGEVIGLMSFGGQAVVLVGQSIYTNLTNKFLSPEMCLQLDSFFVPVNSPIRTFIDGIQFVLRTTIVGFGLMWFVVMFLIVVVAVFGISWLFFYFSSPNGNLSAFLNFRRFDIIASFSAGVPAGWLLHELWNELPFIGYYLPIESAFHIIFISSCTIAVTVLKLADDQEQKLEKALKKKNEDETSKLLNLDTKIGTIEVAGGPTTQDISAADAINTVKKLIPTKSGKEEEELEKWSKKSDLFLTHLGRFCCGAVYGLGLKWAVEAFVIQSLFPVLKSAFYGEELFLFSYMKYGMRTAYARFYDAQTKN